MKNCNVDDCLFPFDQFRGSGCIGMFHAGKTIARKVNIGMGSTSIAVAQTLNVGMGHVQTAIVFDTLHLGMGNVNEVHCLQSTSLHTGMGRLGKVTYYSEEALVNHALNLLNLEASFPMKAQQCELGSTTASARPSATVDDSMFPFDQFRNSSNIGMSHARNAVARTVNIGMGSTSIAVAKTMNVGMGHVETAIVFDKLHLMGNVNEVHCLQSTSLQTGMGRLGKVTYYSSEAALAKHALKLLNMNNTSPMATASVHPPATVPGRLSGEASLAEVDIPVAIPVANTVEGKKSAT